jgi:hypothetical protein
VGWFGESQYGDADFEGIIMPEPYAIVVASGQSVSNAFAIERPNRSLVVEVPSFTAGGEVRTQFSSTSGGAFWTLQRPDGTGLPWAVHSGGGPAIGLIERIPSPWGRLILTSSVTAPTTFLLYTTRRT